MKISLPALLDKIETQNKRIQNKHGLGATRKPDFMLVDHKGGVLSDFRYPAEDEEVDRFCVCVVPSGMFIDNERQDTRKGGFLLPCVDAMFPPLSDAKRNRIRDMVDAVQKAERDKLGIKTAKDEQQSQTFTSQAEIAAARKEALALQAAKEAEEEARKVEERAARRRLFVQRIGEMTGEAWHNGKRLA